MTNPIVFEVEIDTESIGIEIETPQVEVIVEDSQIIIFAMTPGAKDGVDGKSWFFGDGPPTTSPDGVKAGDAYLDLNDGTIYTFGE